MRRRKNFTADFCFLGRDTERDLIASKNGLLHLKKDLKYPLNWSLYLETVSHLREAIEQRAEEVYLFVQLLRDKENARLNRKHSPTIISFNLGDWVLVSVIGTKRERTKIKRKWRGAYQTAMI